MHNIKRIKLVVGMLPLLVLSACGDGSPNKDEIAEIIESYIYGGVSGIDQLTCAKKNNNSPIYYCTFRINSEQMWGGCFVRYGDKWMRSGLTCS